MAAIAAQLLNQLLTVTLRCWCHSNKNWLLLLLLLLFLAQLAMLM
jgi:hypothetical protein